MSSIQERALAHPLIDGAVDPVSLEAHLDPPWALALSFNR